MILTARQHANRKSKKKNPRKSTTIPQTSSPDENTRPPTRTARADIRRKKQTGRRVAKLIGGTRARVLRLARVNLPDGQRTAQHALDRVLLEERGAELREARGGEEEHGLGRLPALLLLDNMRQQTGGDDDGACTESCTQMGLRLRNEVNI